MISASTRVLAVIGHPVAHSFSPLMHNAAIRSLGVDYCYVALHVHPDRVAQAVNGMRGLEIAGMNVTIPHKRAVMEHVDRISEEALAVGAVNTIAWKNDELVGYNTDVYGITRALEETAGLSSFSEHGIVLGAGGAARAAVYALGVRPEVARVTILNRTVERAQSLADDMRKITGKEITAKGIDIDSQRKSFADAGVVVNTTSLGMHPAIDASPVPDPSVIHPSLVVYDTVFNPLETQLMRQALGREAKAFGGLDMLVFQGARSFAIWTGTEPPADVMKQAVVEHFGG